MIYMKKYPVYYAVIQGERSCFIVGPVNVEKQDARKEKRIPYCNYEIFCEEILLLFYALTGKEMTYYELNEKNYITEELRSSMKKEESKLLFYYQEYEKQHNPYDREIREMESIRKGDVERLKKSINEVFSGEYAVLSKNSLRSAKNLAIVGLAISARAAIEGGLSYEEAFSINDSFILKVDAAENVGEIEALVEQAKIQYAGLVYALTHHEKRNPIVEECKNEIFKRMHSRIIIGELADVLHVSKEYLSILFKRTEGISISEYIMRQKMKLAENLLMYSQYSIGQIGLYLGFSSQSHFGATFKKYEGLTPKQYRDRCEKKEFKDEN